MGVAGWRGGTTDLCPGRQKPSRRHWLDDSRLAYGNNFLHNGGRRRLKISSMLSESRDLWLREILLPLSKLYHNPTIKQSVLADKPLSKRRPSATLKSRNLPFKSRFFCWRVILFSRSKFCLESDNLALSLQPRNNFQYVVRPPYWILYTGHNIAPYRRLKSLLLLR